MTSPAPRPTPFMAEAPPFPANLASLVGQFRDDIAFYKDPKYKEHHIRGRAIDPVMSALGWDVENKSGATTEREVIEEDSLVIEGTAKAPDYAFLLNGKRRFYVEAKKPSVNIRDGLRPAFQIRNYSWNASLPYGIVTDFEEWSIYDGRSQPAELDAATVARVHHFRFEAFSENWSWLWGLFSRSAVGRGSLEAYAELLGQPRGSVTVDAAFLKQLRRWREKLAADLVSNNRRLTGPQVNRAVQRLIDRIIFLRIAEARGLEGRRELHTAVQGSGAQVTLQGLFRRANTRYNSGLFHTDPTEAADALVVSDETLKHIVDRLYYPYPYNFAVMPADILGRIYEQFLGDTVVVDNGTALVEQKPEVRKAGGVYYTPTSVVDYLVEETVGPLLTGATPNAVRDIRIVDPACGSGSFLVVAFQYLIDWHTRYYASKPRLARKHLEQRKNGTVRLSTAERARILVSNIYGVDLDRQAVEVTRLSLLLKVLEGQQQLALTVSGVLPNLDGNIVWGNSLVGTDSLDHEEPATGPGWAVRPMDWRATFGDVFADGGSFDAVIGNPPYLNVDASWGKGDPRLTYLKSTYGHIHTDKTDLLFYFIEKAAAICGGEIGYIVSRSFLEATKARKLRAWLGSNTQVREVLDMRDAMVFKAGINTAILRLTKSKAVKKAVFRRYIAPALPPGYTASTLRMHRSIQTVWVAQARLGGDTWNFGDEADTALLDKIDAVGDPVGTVLHVGKGMETGANKAFSVTHREPEEQADLLALGVGYRRARTRDIQPFHIIPDGPVVLYPEDHATVSALPAVVRRRLDEHAQVLKNRAAFKRGNCAWWRFTWPLHKEYFGRPKILCPYRSRSNRFAVDDGPTFLGLTDTTVLYDDGQSESLHYIAAILNSEVMGFRHRFLAKLAGGGTWEFFENTVSKLTIPRRSPGDPEHDRIDALARTIQSQWQVLHSTRVPAERTAMAAELAELTGKIESAVADLFELDADERARLTSG